MDDGKTGPFYYVDFAGPNAGNEQLARLMAGRRKAGRKVILVTELIGEAREALLAWALSRGLTFDAVLDPMIAGL